MFNDEKFMGWVMAALFGLLVVFVTWAVFFGIPADEAQLASDCYTIGAKPWAETTRVGKTPITTRACVRSDGVLVARPGEK